MNLAEIKGEKEVLDETLRLMERGAEIIAQGALADGDWFGRPDVLRRVAKPAPRWDWSYEVVDTKLAPETKAATILQLSSYSELLEKTQGCGPEWMWVIPPGDRFCGRSISRGGICSVLPIREIPADAGVAERRRDGDISRASGALRHMPVVSRVRWAAARG